MTFKTVTVMPKDHNEVNNDLILISLFHIQIVNTNFPIVAHRELT